MVLNQIHRVKCCNDTFKSNTCAKRHKNNRSQLCRICVHCGLDCKTAQRQRAHIDHERCTAIHKEQIATRKAAAAEAKAKKGKSSKFHNTINSTVSTLTSKLCTLMQLCEKQSQQIKHLTQRCNEYDRLFERIRGDIKEHGLENEYGALRMRGIEKHFRRTPLKFQMMFDRIQDLECSFDKRKLREKMMFPDYDRPIQIDPKPGKNGPEFRYRGHRLDKYEFELRELLKDARRNPNEATKTSLRIAIRTKVNLLNKHEYTWPSGRPAIPLSLDPSYKPSEWRARGKSLKERDLCISSSSGSAPPSMAPSPPNPLAPRVPKWEEAKAQLTEESKQPVYYTDKYGIEMPYDDHRCPYQEPLPGKVYSLDHVIRGPNGDLDARDLELTAKIWRDSKTNYLKHKDVEGLFRAIAPRL